MQVLLVHGMFCTAWHMGHLTKGLRETGLAARALDLPRRAGQGLVEHVAFVRSEAERAGAAGSLALVGHSMGGLIALLVAAGLADRPWLRKLALLGSAPPATVNGFTWPNLPAFLPGVIGGGAYLMPPARYDRLFMNRQDAALRQSVRKRLVPESRRVIRCVALPALDRSGASRPRFSARPAFETLVLAGAADRSTPPRVQEAIAKGIPGAECHHLGSPDHYGFIEGEGSDEARAHLLRFLDT